MIEDDGWLDREVEFTRGYGGCWLNPDIRRGTRAHVIGKLENDTVAVQFEDGRTMRLDTDYLKRVQNVAA